MSDLDDLTAAMVLGDPQETVPTAVVRAMAEAALAAGWRPATVYGVGYVPEIVTDPMFPVPEGPNDALDQ